jgi:protein tyrosine phosphatase (PTP) superfamily phosphohydrolase (DUF442 family)
VRRLAICLSVLGLAGLLWAAAPIVFDGNLRDVVPGQVFRRSQPDGADLHQLIDDTGLASILCLRSGGDEQDWFRAERAVAERRDVRLEVVGLSSRRQPSRDEMSRLVAALDGLPRPMLLHCAAGVERSGLASTICRLLEGDSTDAAREHFSLTYGFSSLWSDPDLPLLVDQYADWLHDIGKPSSPELFRAWAADDYVPAFYRAGLEILQLPETVHAGKHIPLEFRVTNLSPVAWEHEIDPDSGVHIEVRLLDGNDHAVTSERTGYADLRIEAGASHDWQLTLPPTAQPGSYRLQIELVNEHVSWFSRMGWPPFELPLDVVVAQVR